MQELGYIDYKQVLDTFVDHLYNKLDKKIVSIILYGSVARGTARPDSDLDLLIVMKKAPESYFERLEPISAIIIKLRNEHHWKTLEERGINPEINVLIFSRQEADRNRYIYLDMIEEARILVDRDEFFQERLKKFKKRLIELGAKKIPINGSWYWDLKPDLKKGETIIL